MLEMNIEKDDVSKLLGQIELKNFPYRAFARPDSAPLRIVRSASSADGAAPAAGAAKPASNVASIDFVPAPPAAAATPAAKPSARVGEAFERLARLGASGNAPHLRLHLDLPPRPAIVPATPGRALTEHRLQDVFERLRLAAVPLSVQPAVGAGK